MMSLGMNNLSSLSSSYTFFRYRAMEPFHDSCIMDYDEIVQEGGQGSATFAISEKTFPNIIFYDTCPTVL